ncbi:efflux RND transporter periplasmic adaptor subunit [Chroococcidiopsis sp.]|uniref:efflux RND transporter periplasmic adaptor subunit n=1 Tax=Chroococcidiopsis sp. TaxID=3088168 RepID=UPI003F34D72A
MRSPVQTRLRQTRVNQLSVVSYQLSAIAHYSLLTSNMEFSLFNQKVKLNSWVLGVTIISVIGGAIAVYLLTNKTDVTPDITSQTVLVQQQDLVVQIPANGVVEAVQKVNLSSEDSARIAKLFVREGDRVKPGQLIARMNNVRLQAQVNQYQALLQKAKADLAEKRAGTRSEEIAEARARVTTAQATVTAAQARLARAREELQRYQQLAQAGAISQNTLGDFIAREREARANLEAEQSRLREQQDSLRKNLNGFRPEEIAQAEAEVNQAASQLAFYQTQLNDTLVRAPFAGIITRRFAQEGDFVTPTTSASASEGATSTSIAELSSGLQIEAKIPEATLSKIRLGQAVNVQADAYPVRTFKGKVSLIAPRAVQENNITSFRVKVGLQTGLTQLKAGMNVRLNFLSDPVKQAIMIPLAAVVTQPDGQTGVYVVNEQQAKFQVVKVGTTSGDRIQVLSGLNSGDRVFLSPPANQQIEGVDTPPPVSM